MDNKYLQEQLLARSLDEPSLAKEVLSKDVPSLLPDKELQTLGYVLVRYYNESTSPISEELFRTKLSDRLNHENTIREKQGKPLIEDEEYTGLMNRVAGVYKVKVDTSSEMANELDRYVKDTLTTQAILEEAGRGQSNLAQRVSERSDEIRDLNITGNITKPLDVMEDLKQRINIYKESYENSKISFGLKPFDDLTMGGLSRGQLALIGGASGFGKTTTLTNLSYRFIQQKHNVLHLSLEELEIDQLIRFDRLIQNLGIKEVLNPDGTVKPDFVQRSNALYKKTDEDSHGMLKFVKSSPDTLTVDDVRQVAVNIERSSQKKLDVIVLDYADLLKKPSNSFGHESEVGERTFQRLVKLAQELDVVLVTGTQLNRSSGDTETMTLHSIEGSFRKINTIALGMTLNANKQEKQEGLVRMYLDKVRNRYGYDDNFLYLKYNLHSMRLEVETPQEIEHHKSLLGGDSAPQVEAKKENNKEAMSDVLNRALGY